MNRYKVTFVNVYEIKAESLRHAEEKAEEGDCVHQSVEVVQMAPTRDESTRKLLDHVLELAQQFQGGVIPKDEL